MPASELSAELFEQGQLVREPVGSGQGYWVGAPGAYHDERDGAFYLTYRIRRPRGVEPDRGGVARIARSTDGVRFDDIWEVQKSAYGTTSIERSTLRRGADGTWRYFTSYVDPADGRWCTAVITGDRIESLDPRTARIVFEAGDVGLEGVKDPVIFEHDGAYHMFLSVAEPTAATGDDAHATHDIYNTGQCLSATGLATSKDLESWQWRGVVLRPKPGGIGKVWDGYCRRINSVAATDGGFVAFYDGSKGHEENYEEKCGIARSSDLRSWQSMTPHQPFVVSEHATGSIRYVDVVSVGDAAHLFYEITRTDGSHELRTLQLPLADLLLSLPA